MLVVKGGERQERSFRGVDFLVGAVGERIMVTLMTFKKGQSVGTHTHPHEQAGYCIEGRFELTVGSVSTVIQPHDSYVIPGDTPHSYLILEDALAVEMFSPPREDYL
jgi:quercetin dioxygenase-like cupin family protein